jgi:peptide/nickel transport system substrate-binding protein
MRIRARALLISALAVLCVTGCDNGGKSQGQLTCGPGKPAYGDSLVEGSIGEPSNLIPILSSDSASHDVAALVYNRLLKYDKDINLTGDLAESWQVSPDGLTITFRLRKGVKWHDGAGFTSRDVLYTYRVTIDPKTPTPYAEDFKQIKKAEAPDPYTFRVTYEKPFSPALSSWTAAYILPAHLLEGKDITRTPLSRKPVGTGPYRFKDWAAGQKLSLESFHEYFEGRPFIDRYVYRIIPDTSTMYMELKAGGLDIMPLTSVQYKRQTGTPEFLARFNKYRYADFSYVYLGYNLQNPLFSDKRVRQAITSAINKDEIVQGALLGMGQIAHGPYKPGTWAYNPGVKDLGYNPEKARTLLAEAGWKRGSDGMLVKDGRPFRFTVLTNQGNEQRLKTAQIIQQRLRAVGIDVKIRVLEWSSFITHFIDKRNFEAVILAWTITPDPDIFDVWHSSKTGPKELNFIGFRNAEVDRLIEEGRRTFDEEKRKRCYYRIQEILAEEQPLTFLYVPDALPAVSARFRGIQPAPAGISYNFIHWYAPKEEQVYR